MKFIFHTYGLKTGQLRLNSSEIKQENVLWRRLECDATSRLKYVHSNDMLYYRPISECK
jgi:hypothetical protein